MRFLPKLNLGNLAGTQFFVVGDVASLPRNPRFLASRNYGLFSYTGENALSRPLSEFLIIELLLALRAISDDKKLQTCGPHRALMLKDAVRAPGLLLI